MSESVFPEARPYPVNLRLANKPVLVVGAGKVAVRKVGQLLAAGANVTVVGSRIDERLTELAVMGAVVGPGSLEIEQRPYRSGEVERFMLAVTCTDDARVNSQVHDDGVAAGVWVNSADDPENCEFTLPSVVRAGDLQIAISTEGRSPALAMWLRRRFEKEFGDDWADLVEVLSEVRDEARSQVGTSEISGWVEALDVLVPEWVENPDRDTARRTLRNHLGLSELEQTR